jgi:hypothetical protein
MMIPNNIQLPAHLQAKVGKPSALSTALAGGMGSGGGYPRISIKGARFRIVQDGTETVLDSTVLEAIIVGANPNLSKTFYAAAWSKDADQVSPDCFSLDGIRPHIESTAPQNDLCASCPKNAWGSKISEQGHQIKACADEKRLAILAADDPEGEVYLLKVTPAALKGLSKYQKELAVRGISPEMVRTRVSFDTDASFPKLTFGFGGFNDEATQTTVDALIGSSQVQEITGEATIHEVPVQIPVRAVTPAPAPAPVAEAPVVEEPAPAPAKGFGKAATKPAVEAPVEEPAPAAKPKAKPAVKQAPVEAASLSDEIADLLEGLGLDD